MKQWGLMSTPTPVIAAHLGDHMMLKWVILVASFRYERSYGNYFYLNYMLNCNAFFAISAS